MGTLAEEVQKLQEENERLRLALKQSTEFWNNRLVDLQKQYNPQIALRGPIGSYQAEWRDFPSYSKPIETFDYRACTDAVLDALLNQGGIAAWDGDGVSCVVQMIARAYRERDVFKKAYEDIVFGRV